MPKKYCEKGLKFSSVTDFQIPPLLSAEASSSVGSIADLRTGGPWF